MKRRAWFLVEFALDKGDMVDIALPDSARPLEVVIDYEQRKLLTVGHSSPNKPVVRIAFEVATGEPEAPRRMRRFIAVPEKQTFEADDYDFVCLFANPFHENPKTSPRLALYEVAYPKPVAVPVITQLPGPGGVAT